MDATTKKPERPYEIDAILKSLTSEHPQAVGNTLNSYISDLENKQLIDVIPKDIPAGLEIKQDVETPQRWSHKRSMDRERFRRQRAAAKRNNFR
jgi:hypothetical protein